MKIIDADTMQQMQTLFDAGHGIRATARACGLHRDTVTKYYRQRAPTACQCGKSMTHRGWCSYRVARSPNRQAMLQKITTLRPSTVGRWEAVSSLSAQRTAFLSATSRLEAGWIRQAVIRENEALGTPYLIAIATQVVEQRLRAPLLAEDVIQDLLVLMLEGKLEAAAVPRSPLVGRAINYEWSLLWAASKVSFDTQSDDDMSLHDLIDASEHQMTKDDLMAIAWRDFVLWAHEQPGMRDAFTAATGIGFLTPASNALEAAIDNACGVHSEAAAAFVKWVTENHWGMDEAPDEYRRAIGADNEASASN